MKSIVSALELVNLMSQAKCGGQFVTIIGESDVKMNKFPTQVGAARVRIDDNFKAVRQFSVKFHFGEDYERKMRKVLGDDTFTASDSNRTHLVKNVIMQYKSTGTTCIIYMSDDYTSKGIFVNGKEATQADLDYIAMYKSPSNSNAVIPYRTLSVNRIKEIHIGGEVYKVDIPSAVYKAVV